jgi:peptidoglycan/LPS O-acetylase OafA/YrhL
VSAIKYRQEIDGLRALAILPVIAFHFGMAWIPGGFVGVDVFFVISGYLITSIILKEHASGDFSLKNFWLRRVRRIMPGMLLMLSATLVAGYFILFGAAYKSLGMQTLSTLLLSANFEMLHLTQNYWGPQADTLPLLHNWSLAVEEQFYLFFPLIALVCLKRSQKLLGWCLVAICAVSYFACVRVTNTSVGQAFYLLPTRAWELAVGCLLAVLAAAKKEGALASFLAPSQWLALLGVAIIAASWFVIHGNHFPGRKAMLPVLGAAMVIQFTGAPGCWATKALSLDFLRFIGKISYSLYLWHWPVIVLGRAAQTRWDFPSDGMLAVLMVLLAVIAYYAVESPCRKVQNIVPPVSAAAGALAALSIIAVSWKPVYNLAMFKPTVWLGCVYNSAPRQIPLTGSIKERLEGIEMPQRDARWQNAYREGGVFKLYGGGFPKVIVMGDSHALMWAPTIDQICKEQKISVDFYAADGAYPVPAIPPELLSISVFTPEEWYAYDSNRVAIISSARPALIVIASRWTTFKEDKKLERFVDFASSQNCKILFIGDPPELSIGNVNTPEFVASTMVTTVRPHRLKELYSETEKLGSFSKKYSGIEVLETDDLFLTPAKRVIIRNNDSIYYVDGDHLSVAGAMVGKQRIEAKLREMLKPS